MRNLFFLSLIFVSISFYANAKVIKITAEPKEAAIYVNNAFLGYGYGEFTKPKKKNEVAIIRIECEEYNPILTKFYGGDKRESLSFALMQDGFYRASASSGIVNKFFTINVDSQYYNNVKITNTSNV